MLWQRIHLRGSLLGDSAAINSAVFHVSSSGSSVNRIFADSATHKSHRQACCTDTPKQPTCDRQHRRNEVLSAASVRLQRMKKGSTRWWSLFLCKIPAIAYFHALRHYHWSPELNGRVRNGNVCFLRSKSPVIRRCASKAALICEKNFLLTSVCLF